MKSKSDKIIIVSGLPRCGTSMMMQMLESGGLMIVTDHVRKADEDNPRGYYEFEKVKEIEKSTDWLDDCIGKAFKMVSALLYHLPENRKYIVIFMERDIKEMLASQSLMLKRKGIKDDRVSDEEMSKKFKNHLKSIKSWLENQRHIDTIYINYNDVIQNPYENARRLNKFLGIPIDVNNMARIVKKSLYRQKRRNLDVS